jgi:16S rRNA processing protein RimM
MFEVKNVVPLKDRIVIGTFGSPYGVKGWMKFKSRTQDPEAFLAYEPWFIEARPDYLILEDSQKTPKGFLIKLVGVDSPEDARAFSGKLLMTDINALPDLMEQDFYWKDLVGLQVILESGDVLGILDAMIETGANDVMSVQPCPNSIDQQIRLIPYLWKTVVKEVNLSEKWIKLDWDASF